ncbi:hypothetical protein DAPPUDRAFT_317204 [Daphnia pulex]|uniref:Uncharacterized protein n=1 Tax=Daphnia pulex TaxID=6669 RepID=E9GF84_DAPPU|nr:hypothetical protein DAPPUDRAFT_317204 [Daphnia pulex]|eukprot:EFX81593.1 hypothetical protein DAPPUDRAFT_317204 [Daphnia pulex]
MQEPYQKQQDSTTNDCNGQYILLSASPNDAVLTTSITSFGKISEKFLKIRTGTCLTLQWYTTTDAKQKERLTSRSETTDAQAPSSTDTQSLTEAPPSTAVQTSTEAQT